MKAYALAVFTASLLYATDPQQLALTLKAQSDYERVEMMSRPGISDTDACTLSEAAALSTSLPEERSLLYYRKGYCMFAGAIATRNSGQLQGAVSELDKSIEAW